MMINTPSAIAFGLVLGFGPVVVSEMTHAPEPQRVVCVEVGERAPEVLAKPDAVLTLTLAVSCGGEGDGETLAVVRMRVADGG